MATKVINNRVNFARVKNPMPYPDFLDVQLESFKDFLQLDTPPEERKNDGLYKVFAENFPITDTRNNFVLEFLDYYIDPPRYSIEECLERGLTYSVPMKARMKLYCTDPDHEDFAPVTQDVFLGTIPYMTSNGTFVINGAERVVVAQLHRSPGVFFGQGIHANGTVLYSARIIPFKGSWIEFATDINNVMYAYIDRKKKLPVTTLLRAIGYEKDKDILEIFNLAEEVKVTKKNLNDCIGRTLAANIMKSWYEDYADEDTGEVVSIERNDVIIERGTVISEDNVEDILDSNVSTILLTRDEENASKYSIIFNTLSKDTSNSEKEAVYYIYRQLRNADPADEASAREVIQNLFFSDKRYDLGEVGRYRINKKLNLNTDIDVRILTKEDIICIIKYLINLINSSATVDDIDHLSNRRVKTVGEQLANQFSIGLARMSRTIRERMNVRDNEVFTPTDLINAKTISSVINSFFGTNPLSQFMDQTNPLAEVTHKRRLSALGPGGLSRERAGFEVRDVHYTHYGRLCPIEKVVKILCDEQKATAVQTEDESLYKADWIISTIHPSRLMELLQDTKLIRPAFRNRINSIPQTSGVFAVYLKFKEGRMPYLNSNYFGYKGSSPWDCEHYSLGEWPKGFLYMHMCHERQPLWAKSAVVLSYMNMAEVEAWKGTRIGHRGEDYERFKRERAEILLAELERQRPGTLECVEDWWTSTPLTYLDYTGTEKGSMYGVAKDINAGAAGRVPYRTKIPNLLLAGQNVNSHGMLGVIVGTVVTCAELVPAATLYSQIKKCR